MTRAEKRTAKRKQMRIADAVAKTLGVKRENAVLFQAVAAAMCVPFTGGKKTGYALVHEYANAHGIQPAPSKFRRRVVVPQVTDEFLQSYQWRQLRMVVITKRGARCECCGAVPSDGVTVINVDHVKPRRLFPELALDESNLQVLCHVCNHGKGNWDQTDWRADVKVDPLRPRLVKRQA